MMVWCGGKVKKLKAGGVWGANGSQQTIRETCVGMGKVNAWVKEAKETTAGKPRLCLTCGLGREEHKKKKKKKKKIERNARLAEIEATSEANF